MSQLLVPFLYELRKKNVRAGTQEIVTLAEGLTRGLHGNSLEGFYYLARAVLVHREGDLDRFDQAFLQIFRGIETKVEELFRDAAERDPPDWIRELLGRNLDGESEVGDGDRGPEGEGGAGGEAREPRPGRGATGRGTIAATTARGSTAVGMADARRYRRYRSDLVLDVRQIEVALRRLKIQSRDGRPDELDVDATVDATARAFGDLELVLRPPKKSNVRVLLLMDVGGSMEPYATLCSQLFSAAKRASNLRELRTYYFHNVPYGRVFSADGQMTPTDLPELLELVNRRWKLVVVGDASMAPGEMLSVGPWGSSWRRDDGGAMRGFDWLTTLAERFDRSVWLNPDPPSYWVGGTVEVIRQVFQMYPLTLEGLGDAVPYLSKETIGKRPEVIGNPRNAL